MAGLWLAMIWVNRASSPPPQTAQPETEKPAFLIAQNALPAGTLLREGDFGWREVDQAEARPGQLMRGQVTDREFLGAITRRSFAEGEALTAGELVKPSDRRFLSAVLRPDRRAVSISVDAPQSASGLVLPGDFVDVILTQNFGDNLTTTARRAVGETVLRHVRIVAVDQSLGAKTQPAGENANPAQEARLPKTITLELDERQAQSLFVAMQLGKLQLAVRPLEGAGVALAEANSQPSPTWASDVSPAIRQLSLTNLQPSSSGSSVESAVRRPPPTALQ
jgi:pilus assembly protein CpaB